MEGMLARLAHWVVRHRRAVLVAAVVTFAVAGTTGGNVASQLSSGGFDDPASESFKADETLLDEFGTGTPNFILLVTANQGDVDSESAARAGMQLTSRLADEPHLVEVFSYWSLFNYPSLRNDDGTRALVFGRIEGSDDEVNEIVETLAPEYDGLDSRAVDVEVGGLGPTFQQVGTTIEDDLARAELIALPITLVLLLLVFGSAVAAALPLAIGALSVVGTFVVLRVLSELTEVSVFALSLTTAMGVGLAIDYALFVVSRFREELRAGHEPHDAVVRTVRTAGRTVAFSAMTVAASLLALLVFPLAFLRSFAYAGVAVAALAGVFSLVVLPALLAALGHRVDKGAVRRRTLARSAAEEDGFWHRMALFVMRRPLPVATVAILVLLLLGTPFLGIRLGLPDDRVLPESASTRQVSDVIRAEFQSEEAGALSVVVPDLREPTSRRDDIGAYADRLSALDGVREVRSVAGIYADGERTVPPNDLLERFATDDATYLQVVPSVEPLSPEGETLVETIRGLDAPFTVQVTGQSAFLVDAKESLFDRLPIATLIIAIVTFTVLFLMFGSVVIPLKAIVLNLLSLSATFGAMVWIFQDGHLAGVLDFTPTGTISAVTPILMFCIAFGISMDYEVFLLSRIKEEHDRTQDNTTSVALGLERTGRIVTAAAALISIVFVAFGTSSVSFIKLFGIGLTLAVLMDAFLIRGTLVPAFMRLAGEWNWWAPAPLRRFHARFGIAEHVELEPAPSGPEDQRDRTPVAAGVE